LESRDSVAQEHSIAHIASIKRADTARLSFFITVTILPVYRYKLTDKSSHPIAHRDIGARLEKCI
jgi:hypothetical protein